MSNVKTNLIQNNTIIEVDSLERKYLQSSKNVSVNPLLTAYFALLVLLTKNCNYKKIIYAL